MSRTIDFSDGFESEVAPTVGDVHTNQTVNRATATDANGDLVASPTTDTQLGYLQNLSEDLQTSLNAKEATANKGQANGYASLDANGLVPSAQIPPAALERLVVVADQTARYALTTVTAQNGDTVYQTDTSTMYLVKDDTNLANSAGYQEYSAGTSVNFSGSLSGDITGTQGATQYNGTLPLNKGGTGQTVKAAAFDALSPMTTKGDIPVFSTTGVRLPVGTDGQVLTADSAQSTGLKWSTVLTNPMTTGGDLIYGGASGAATRLANGSSGQVLTSAGGTSAPAWSSLVALIGSQGLMTVFTASGTFTTPSSSSTSTIYKYFILGGGGGGGGANGAGAVAAGGGAGAFAMGTFTGVSASTGITITVGAAGSAGTSAGGNGGNGGSSSIGTPVSITAGGGSGGTGNIASGSGGSEGGAGGTITGSPTMSFAGCHGGRGWSTAASVGVAGYGASSPFGGGGVGGSLNVAQAPAAATGYGSGGGGGFLITTAGGAGTAGIVIIVQLTP